MSDVVISFDNVSKIYKLYSSTRARLAGIFVKKVPHKLKKAVDVAESQGVETIDGVTYDASHIWRDVAQMALDLADQQEWFDRYDAKYCN